MTRNDLPQNYIKTPAVVLEAMDALTGWTVSGASCTLALDAVNGGIACTSLVAGGFTQFYKNGSFDLSKSNYIEFDLYIPEIPKFEALTTYLFTDAGYSKYFTYGINYSICAQGLNKFRIYKKDFTPTASPDFNNNITRIRFGWNPKAGQNTTINIDNILINQKSSAKEAWVFDDGYKSVIDVAFPILQARGIVGTVYVTTSTIGADGYLTLADLRILKAAGWTIAIHTHTHPHLATLTKEEQRAEFQQAINILYPEFGESCMHAAYPYGEYNQDTLDLMLEMGFKTARRTTNGLTRMPFADIYALNTVPLDTTVSDAQHKAYVDKAIYQGDLMTIMGHGILTTPVNSYDVATANLITRADYSVMRKTDNLNIDDLFNGLTNPRKTVVRS